MEGIKYLVILDEEETERLLVSKTDFKCNVCDENFETDGDLRLHQTIHVKSHTCIHCNKEFTSKYNIIFVYRVY